MGVLQTGTNLSKSAYVSMTTVIAFCSHGRLEKPASEFGCKNAATWWTKSQRAEKVAIDCVQSQLQYWRGSGILWGTLNQVIKGGSYNGHYPFLLACNSRPFLVNTSRVYASGFMMCNQNMAKGEHNRITATSATKPLLPWIALTIIYSWKSRNPDQSQTKRDTRRCISFFREPEDTRGCHQGFVTKPKYANPNCRISRPTEQNKTRSKHQSHQAL